MHCEICGSDAKLLLLLPLRQPDGKLETLVCERCAEKSPAYCSVHQHAHQGFFDGTTACLLCVEHVVAGHLAYGDQIYARLFDHLP